MFNTMFKIFGKRVATHTVQKHTGAGRLLDVRFGFLLFRDRRVSLFTKLLAVGLGMALTTLLIGLELPIEAIITGLLNLLGLGMVTAVDGIETIVGPVLFAALLLPHLAPKELVFAKRSEQEGTIDSVVDEPATPSRAYLTPREDLLSARNGR